jgi:hypothetical protein
MARQLPAAPFLYVLKKIVYYLEILRLFLYNASMNNKALNMWENISPDIILCVSLCNFVAKKDRSNQ